MEKGSADCQPLPIQSRPMNSLTATRVLQRGLLVAGGGLLGGIVQYAGAWLVRHDSAYYRVSDAGFRFVTDAAEIISLFGPVPAVLGGLLVGWGLSGLAEYRRRSLGARSGSETKDPRVERNE